MKIIPLKNSKKFVLIDDIDFEQLSKYIWYEAKRKNNSYAITGSANKKILLHRFLMKPANSKEQIDHKDGNGLNNQRSNLRLCSNQQNMFNRKKQTQTSSRYKGVYWNSERKKWQVSVKTLEGKTKSLGRYVDENQAAKVYNEYVSILYGKFAKLNIVK